MNVRPTPQRGVLFMAKYSEEDAIGLWESLANREEYGVYRLASGPTHLDDSIKLENIWLVLKTKALA